MCAVRRADALTRPPEVRESGIGEGESGLGEGESGIRVCTCRVRTTKAPPRLLRRFRSFRARTMNGCENAKEDMMIKTSRVCVCAGNGCGARPTPEAHLAEAKLNCLETAGRGIAINQVDQSNTE